MSDTITRRKKTKMFRLWISPELHERLMRVAKLRETSSSEIAREGMLKHIASEEQRPEQNKEQQP